MSGATRTRFEHVPEASITDTSINQSGNLPRTGSTRLEIQTVQKMREKGLEIITRADSIAELEI
jgi:hypothetical protein